MNNMKIKQREDMRAAFDVVSKCEELTDEAMDAVTGGAVLTGLFYVAKCNRCDWHAAFDDRGEYDLEMAVSDHMHKSPNCDGDFAMYHFNK